MGVEAGRDPYCARCGEYQVGYGFPWLDDPRDFMPDDECVTAEEWVRWAEDCHRAAAGLPVDGPRGCSAQKWGMGAYWDECQCGWPPSLEEAEAALPPEERAEYERCTRSVIEARRRAHVEVAL